MMRRAMLVSAVLTAPALAHEFTITDVLVVLKRNDTYLIDMTVDVDALALGVPASTDSEWVYQELTGMDNGELAVCIERARGTIERRVRIRFDGTKVAPDITFPEYRTALTEDAPIPSLLGITARLTGKVPPGATSITFAASRAFNAVDLSLFEEQTGRTARHLLAPSEPSPPFALGEGGGESLSRRDVAGRYLILGFEHIIPLGLDHILFVLGLFLLSPKPRPILWQVTAFTVAHSVTLALSIYDVVSLPSRLVESLIALSIAYVAIENIVTSTLKPWRPVVVFIFGLLHGLGFAGVLRELGLPRGEFVTALVSFNVGVEFGQLGVVALAFLTVGWFRQDRRYRSAIVIPASVLIALTGFYWFVERAFT